MARTRIMRYADHDADKQRSKRRWGTGRGRGTRDGTGIGNAFAWTLDGPLKAPMQNSALPIRIRTPPTAPEPSALNHTCTPKSESVRGVVVGRHAYASRRGRPVDG